MNRQRAANLVFDFVIHAEHSPPETARDASNPVALERNDGF
jgi:hypothetical protein